MRPELRSAAIKAIQEGDMATLKAIRRLAKESGDIPVYLQVLGENQLYAEDGTPIESPPEPEPMPEGIPPRIGSIVVCFSTYEQMERSRPKIGGPSIGHVSIREDEGSEPRRKI